MASCWREHYAFVAYSVETITTGGDGGVPQHQVSGSAIAISMMLRYHL